MSERIEVVDENDRVVGIEDRDIVHSLGLRHRIAHTLIYNEKGEILLQVRAPDKKIYPGKWDCSCSEHLKPGEEWKAAAMRGLDEELGMRNLELSEVLYCRGDYGLEGKAISKIFTSTTDTRPSRLDTVEVYRYSFLSKANITEMLTNNPDKFAVWAAEQLKCVLGMANALEPLKPTRSRTI